MKLIELTDYLEQIAPLRFQEGYDNSGLIVGDPEMKLTGAIVALDATPSVIQEAIDLNVNLVLTHHPIVFKGIKQFNQHHYVHQSVIKAIKNDIALYAIHTNLDNVLKNGVNQKIAQRLQLSDLQVLRSHENAHLETRYQTGSGLVGKLKTPMDGQQFIQLIKEQLQLKVVRHTKILEGAIRKVALCGGSGSFLLPDAIKAGAEVFLTADFKYHEFFDANDKLLITDVGHYESEFFTIELLVELISKKFPNFAAHYTKVITNPVFYS